MNALTKAFIFLFSFIGALLLFLGLLRLANGNDAFVGVSDIYYAFSEIDLLKPFKKLIEYLDNLKDEFYNDVTSWESLDLSINSFTDFFKAFANFFKYIGILLYDVLKFIGLPFYLSYYLMEFIITLFGSFFSFISNVIV